MIVPDLNLLLYSYDSASPYHHKAVVWWQDCLSGMDPVGLPPVVIFGFVRLSTSNRVFQHPMTPAEASDHVRSWLAQPVVQILEPGADHIAQTLKLLEGLGTGGNLVTDAQIAAITTDHSAILHTADADFARFPGLRWTNPLTGQGSRTRRSPSHRQIR